MATSAVRTGAGSLRGAASPAASYPVAPSRPSTPTRIFALRADGTAKPASSTAPASQPQVSQQSAVPPPEASSSAANSSHGASERKMVANYVPLNPFAHHFINGGRINSDFRREYLDHHGKSEHHYDRRPMEHRRLHERRERKRLREHGSEMKQSLGTGQPDLRFGHKVTFDNHQTASVVQTVASEWFDLVNINFNPGQGGTTPFAEGWCFSMTYTHAAGLRFHKSNPTVTTAAYMTRDPTTATNPVTYGDSNQGFYDLFLADHYFSPIFKYTHIEGVELEYRLIPIIPQVGQGQTTSNVEWGGLTSMGDFTMYPWFGEPYINATASTGHTYTDLNDPNYQAGIHPKVCHKWPMPGAAVETHRLGFIPSYPILYSSENDTLAFQSTPPTDTITWAAGDSSLNGYLGRWVFYVGDVAWEDFPDVAGINWRISARWIVKQRWWELFPPLLFQFPTPRVDEAVWKQFCRAAIDQDKQYQALAIAEVQSATGGAVAPAPDGVTDELSAAAAALTTDSKDKDGDDDMVIVSSQPKKRKPN